MLEGIPNTIILYSSISNVLHLLSTRDISTYCRGVTSIEAEEAVASSLFADVLNH